MCEFVTIQSMILSQKERESMTEEITKSQSEKQLHKILKLVAWVLKKKSLAMSEVGTCYS